jgi:uncharacterized RDD family membrane protein YckC
MKCPACHYVCSDLRDICPKCLLDLRPSKKSLGLPISYPDSSYAVLVRKQIPGKKGGSNPIESITGAVSSVGNFFKRLAPAPKKSKPDTQTSVTEPVSEDGPSAENLSTTPSTSKDSPSPTPTPPLSAQEEQPTVSSKNAALEYQLRKTTQAAPTVIEMNEATLEESLMALEQSEIEIEAVTPKRNKQSESFEFDFFDELSEEGNETDVASSTNTEVFFEEGASDEFEFVDSSETVQQTDNDFNLRQWLEAGFATMPIAFQISTPFKAKTYQPTAFHFPPSFSLKTWVEGRPAPTKIESPKTTPPAAPASSAVSTPKPVLQPTPQAPLPKPPLTKASSNDIQELFTRLEESARLSSTQSSSVVEIGGETFLTDIDRHKIDLIFDRLISTAQGSAPQAAEIQSVSRVVQIDSSSMEETDIDFVSKKKHVRPAGESLPDTEFLFPASWGQRLTANIVDILVMVSTLGIAVALSQVGLEFVGDFTGQTAPASEALWVLISCTAIGIVLLPTIYYGVAFFRADQTPGMRLRNLVLRQTDESVEPRSHRIARALAWPISIFSLGFLFTLLSSRGLLDRALGQQMFLRVQTSGGDEEIE